MALSTSNIRKLMEDVQSAASAVTGGGGATSGRGAVDRRVSDVIFNHTKRVKRAGGIFTTTSGETKHDSRHLFRSLALSINPAEDLIAKGAAIATAESTAYDDDNEYDDDELLTFWGLCFVLVAAAKFQRPLRRRARLERELKRLQIATALRHEALHVQYVPFDKHPRTVAHRQLQSSIAASFKAVARGKIATSSTSGSSAPEAGTGRQSRKMMELLFDRQQQEGSSGDGGGAVPAATESSRIRQRPPTASSAQRQQGDIRKPISIAHLLRPASAPKPRNNNEKGPCKRQPKRQEDDPQERTHPMQQISPRPPRHPQPPPLSSSFFLFSSTAPPRTAAKSVAQPATSVVPEKNKQAEASKEELAKFIFDQPTTRSSTAPQQQERKHPATSTTPTQQQRQKQQEGLVIGSLLATTTDERESKHQRNDAPPTASREYFVSAPLPKLTSHPAELYSPRPPTASGRGATSSRPRGHAEFTNSLKINAFKYDEEMCRRLGDAQRRRANIRDAKRDFMLSELHHYYHRNPNRVRSGKESINAILSRTHNFVEGHLLLNSMKQLLAKKKEWFDDFHNRVVDVCDGPEVRAVLETIRGHFTGARLSNERKKQMEIEEEEEEEEEDASVLLSEQLFFDMVAALPDGALMAAPVQFALLHAAPAYSVTYIDFRELLELRHIVYLVRFDKNERLLL